MLRFFAPTSHRPGRQMLCWLAGLSLWSGLGNGLLLSDGSHVVRAQEQTTQAPATVESDVLPDEVLPDDVQPEVEPSAQSELTVEEEAPAAPMPRPVLRQPMTTSRRQIMPPAAASAGAVRPAMGRSRSGVPGRPVSQADQFCPSCERVPLICEEVCTPSALEHYRRLYPDEYLCDGGDRDDPVHFDDYNMQGLETEDTVVQYQDDTGKARIRPTNRVCIYAPRFAAVSVISGTLEDHSVARAAANKQNNNGSNLKLRQATVAHLQQEGTQRMVTRLRGSGFKHRLGAQSVHLDLAPAVHAQALRAFAAQSFLRTGILKRSEEAILADGLQAAAVWSKQQMPVIAAHLSSTGELVTKKAPADLSGLEDNRRPGHLRIVKLADRQQAEPGDLITFSIRYDNLGEKELRQIVITDNLTPRLEYVDDSATSDRDGELTLTENDSGSVILRWTFDQPLKGGESGVVTFQTKVR